MGDNAAKGRPGQGHGAEAQNPIAGRIPLDAKQSYRLKSSWKAVHRKLEDAGVMIFIKILQENPQVRPAYNSVYSKCANPSNVGALSNDEGFRSQALLYMQRIDEVVQNFDNPNDLFRQLVSVAELHRPDRQNIAKNQLQAFVKPFMDTMRSILEDRFNEQIEEIYKKAILFIVSETETLVRDGPPGSH